MSRAALAVLAVGCSDAVAPVLDAPAALVDAPPNVADAERPTRLSQAGLYVPGTRDLAPGLAQFEPTHALWSDGAVKRRWVALPVGAIIDTTDADHWQFPVGTRFWKEFATPDGTLLETRLVERIAATGDDERDYWLGAFVWDPAGSDAVFVEAGATNINGTQHDVPSAARCRTCHGGEPGYGLGFGAVQLSGAGSGVRLHDLGARGQLSHAIAEAPAPGDPVTAAALGTLHANCGHCHNPNGGAWPDASMDLRLYVAERTPEATAIYRTAVGVPLFRFMHAGLALRIAPGEPARSAITFRMATRGSTDQMPPIATERVDVTGLAAVTAWIEEL